MVERRAFYHRFDPRVYDPGTAVHDAVAVA